MCPNVSTCCPVAEGVMRVRAPGAGGRAALFIRRRRLATGPGRRLRVADPQKCRDNRFPCDAWSNARGHFYYAPSAPRFSDL